MVMQYPVRSEMRLRQVDAGLSTMIKLITFPVDILRGRGKRDNLQAVRRSGTEGGPEEKAREEMEERWYYSFFPNNVAGGGTQPLIPIFITEALGGTVAQVGIISAAQSVASVPSSVFWGDLSDRTKMRKRFAMLGFIGMGISLLLMGFAQSIEQFFLANILLGLLATASAPIGIVLVMESSKEKKWSQKIGRFSRIGGWGWVSGLVIGTVWLFMPFGSREADAMRMLFVISALLAFVSAYMAYIWIDEPQYRINRPKAGELAKVHFQPHEKGRFLPMRMLHLPRFGNIRKLKLHGFGLGHELSYYFAIVFMMMTAFILFYTIFPIFLVQSLRISPGEVFIVYLSSSIASALVYAKAGLWCERTGAKRIQVAAMCLRIIIIPSFLVSFLIAGNHYLTLAVLVCLQAGMGTCWAMIAVSGTTIVSELAPKEARGESIGLYTAVQGTASIMGAVLGGVVAFVFGYYVAIFLAAALLVAAAVMLLRIKLITKECVRVAEG